MSRTPAVAILSPGEMGHAIGRVLVHHGLRVITSLDGRSERTRGLSQAAADLYRWVGETRLGQEHPESRDQSRSLRTVIEEFAESHGDRIKLR